MLEQDAIVMEIEDDGIGRERAGEILAEQNKIHQSLSTSITRERIRILNKKLKHKITLDIIDLKDIKGDPAGTKVKLGIPVEILQAS
jgi:hypothetical protein